MHYISSYFDPTLPLLPDSLFHFLCFRVCSVKINVGSVLSSQLAAQMDMGCNSLGPHSVINVHWLALQKACFSIQWGTKWEEAFNTNATVCIASNCHFQENEWAGDEMMESVGCCRAG